MFPHLLYNWWTWPPPDLAMLLWLSVLVPLLQGGPSPRSCHKICLDPEGQVLYVLGKYLDQETRTSLFTVTVPVSRDHTHF